MNSYNQNWKWSRKKKVESETYQKTKSFDVWIVKIRTFLTGIVKCVHMFSITSINNISPKIAQKVFLISYRMSMFLSISNSLLRWEWPVSYCHTCWSNRISFAVDMDFKFSDRVYFHHFLISFHPIVLSGGFRLSTIDIKSFRFLLKIT